MKSFNLKITTKTIKPNVKKSEYAVELTNITKRFGSILANDGINLKVKRNTIHAIIGENGAGKSTLMSILFGLYKQEKGTIKVNGKPTNFKSANDATKEGIGMVHQHFKLVKAFSLLDNIILGAEITKCGILRNDLARQKILQISRKYSLPIDLNVLAENAPVAEQQRAEILKLLYRDSEILIFDEPTAILSDAEIKNFLKMLLAFKKIGKTIILITHKLSEVKEVADTATIIRLGKWVANVNVKTTSLQKMADLMVGKHLTQLSNPMLGYTESNKEVVLSVKNLHALKASGNKVPALRGISFDLHQGEILGIAGVEGNGQTELAMILGGLLKPQEGEIYFFNNRKRFDLKELNVKEIYDAGVSHVPEDRQKYGLFLDETVAYNCVAPIIHHKPFSKWGFINKGAIKRYAQDICVRFDVRGSNRGQALVRSLSGGNQQKLVFGREITRPHKLIVYVQPTRGLDLGAIEQIHQMIISDAKKGNAVILISYELDEIFKISSSIIVMNNGYISYKGLTKNTTRSMIGHHISTSTHVNASVGGAHV